MHFCIAVYVDAFAVELVVWEYSWIFFADDLLIVVHIVRPATYEALTIHIAKLADPDAFRVELAVAFFSVAMEIAFEVVDALLNNWIGHGITFFDFFSHFS